MTDTPPSLAGDPKLRWQEATIAAIATATPRVKSFLFAPAEPIPFRAGQHVDVRLTAPDGYQVERSYSIASAPERTDGIELAIERLDGGEVSPFFHRRGAADVDAPRRARLQTAGAAAVLRADMG